LLPEITQLLSMILAQWKKKINNTLSSCMKNHPREKNPLSSASPPKIQIALLLSGF